MNNCFVFETLNDVKQLKQEKKDGLMTLSGVFGVCGVRNNNNRVYEKSNYGKMVEEMQERIKVNGAIPGELEHPTTMNINLENISHKITDIQINEEGVVSGTIQLLNTPKGKIAQAIVEGKLPLFVSSRATGQVDKDGNVTLEKLACFDLVGTPGFSQAQMHLNESQVCETLTNNIFIIKENNSTVNENNDNKDMNEEIQERLNALQNQIDLLKEENELLKESQRKNIETLAENVQNWVIEDYSPVLQKWVVEEYNAQAIKDYKTMLVKEASPLIQKWIVEEFAPEVQKWVVEHYSPEVQNWCIEQFAPGLQKWMLEEFSPNVQNWLNEHFMINVKEKIEESLANNKDSKLKSITETLSLLEGLEVKKPEYQGRMINENNVEEPLYIQQMPEDLRPKYNMASKEVKESIARRAAIFDFSKEGGVERFWERINFEDVKPVTEGLVDLNTIPDRKEREIRAMFRRNRGLL